MQIDRSEEQYEHAESPMLEMREPYSNAKCERFVQFLKQEAEIVSIDEGMQILPSGNWSDEAQRSRLRIDSLISQPSTETVHLGKSRWLSAPSP
jgi:hypothetical protein